MTSEGHTDKNFSVAIALPLPGPRLRRGRLAGSARRPRRPRCPVVVPRSRPRRVRGYPALLVLELTRNAAARITPPD
jgi:hypothetical protein